MDLVDERPNADLAQAESRGDRGQDLSRVAQRGEIDKHGASSE
jgi:hypothetical protein